MSVFRRDSMVLHFGPRLPKGQRWSRRRYLLWPALLYRVVAPELRTRHLNVLQKGVLGLCRAGVTDAARIGDRLRLHRDLAAIIALELQRRDLLGASGLPTEAGLRVFEEEVLDAGALVTGHVFQDPWSGELWPRFATRLDPAACQLGQDGFPELTLGKTGRPRRERPYLHLPEGVAAPPPPSVEEILQAARRHRRAERGEEDLEATDEDDQRASLTGVAVDRVSLIDDGPTPVLLTTFAFLPEDGDLSDWDVCDPFGLGRSAALRRRIHLQAQGAPLLRAALESLVGRGLEERADDLRRWAIDLRGRAAQQLDAALTLDVRRLPHYEVLLDVEVGRLEAELFGDDYPEHRRRDLLGAGRRALEASLAAVAAEHPPRDAWRRLFTGSRPIEDRAYCRDVYRGAAAAIGLDTPLPEALARVPPVHLKAACTGDVWRLRAATMAAVLAARDDLGHPLRRAATAAPDLLAAIEAVAGAAGRAVHAGPRALGPAQTQATIEKLYYAVGALFGLAVPSAATVGRS